MRVMLLVDHDHPTSAAVREDLAFLRNEIDPERLRFEVCALRGEAAGADHVLDVHGTLDPRASRRLYHLLKAHDIELLHALDTPTLSYAAAAALFADIPLLASVYAVRAAASTEARAMQRLYWRGLARVIQRVVVPSEMVQRQLWLATNYPKEHMQIIHPPLYMSDTVIADRAGLELPDGPLATVIAPDTPDEGYEVLFEVMTRVKQRVPEVHFACAGDRASIAAWQRKLANIRPAPPVRWIIEPPNVDAVIAASDVILAHPGRDSWPTALVRAALLGKPVVASRVGGVTEIVEPAITGLLVTPGDVRDFALQAIRLLTQPTFAERLGKEACRRAQEMYSPYTRRDTLTVLYEATIYATR